MGFRRRFEASGAGRRALERGQLPAGAVSEMDGEMQVLCLRGAVLYTLRLLSWVKQQ